MHRLSEQERVLTPITARRRAEHTVRPVGRPQTGDSRPAAPHDRRFAWLRIVLGGLWLTDGLFKWQPGVLASFLEIVKSAAKGQPGPLHALLQWSAGIMAHAPQLASRAVGTGEILIGCLLILGIGSRLALLASMVFALMIWVFGEGFNQVFSGTATDVGASPLYLLLALAIYLGQGWTSLTLARPIRSRIAR
jgi:uncharacterized membrane protein YphA (DoxX/SURF4 family)